MMEPLSLDHKIICEIVEEGAKVLDLGCGDGDLLDLLIRTKRVNGHGIEIDEKCIYKCVGKGLSVFHGDIDGGLSEYPDRSLDYVILNQSFQQVKKVEFVLKESLRVAPRVIVGFPNFAHLGARSHLFFRGQAPVSRSLPFRWYDTPNRHFLSIRDFREYCRTEGIKVLKARYLGASREVRLLPNLRALNALFVLGPGQDEAAG